MCGMWMIRTAGRERGMNEDGKRMIFFQGKREKRPQKESARSKNAKEKSGTEAGAKQGQKREDNGRTLWNYSCSPFRP